ncbi:MAG: hypothetical protein QXF82_02940 [Nitrososphaeria archaeon]
MNKRKYKELKTDVITIRVRKDTKQQILKFAYENNMTITEVLIYGFENFKKLDVFE